MELFLSKLKSFSVPYGIVLSFAALFQFSLNPLGAFQGDSSAYGFGASSDWSNLSFTGNALRNWPVVLVNLSLGNQMLQVGFQFLIFVASWTFLISQTKYLLSGTYRHLLCFLITVLGLSPQVMSWNSTLLSEGHSISVLIFFVGLVIGYNKNRTSKRKALILFVLFAWISIKPSNYFVSLLALAVFFLTYVLISTWRKKLIGVIKRNLPLSMAVLLLFSWASFVNWNQSSEYYQYKLDYKGVAAVAVLSNQNPGYSQLSKELVKTRNFSCMDLGQPITIPENLEKLNGDDCEKDRSWLSNNFRSWYIKFLVLHPRTMADLVSFGALAGNSPYGFYSGTASIVPKSFSSLYFGERNYALRLSQTSEANFPRDELIAFTPIVAWGLILMMLQLRRILHYFEKKLGTRNYIIGMSSNLEIVMLIISLVGIAGVSVLSPSEWFRQTIQFQVLFYLAVLFSIANEVSKSNKTD